MGKPRAQFTKEDTMDISRRYWLFSGDFYYPRGGMEDFRGSFDTVLDAVMTAADERSDWWQVLDTKTSTLYDSYSVCAYSNKAEWAKSIDETSRCATGYSDTEDEKPSG